METSGAAAATDIFRGDESRRRRGWSAAETVGRRYLASKAFFDAQTPANATNLDGACIYRQQPDPTAAPTAPPSLNYSLSPTLAPVDPGDPTRSPIPRPTPKPTPTPTVKPAVVQAAVESSAFLGGVDAGA